jgi:hypothetical protein
VREQGKVAPQVLHCAHTDRVLISPMELERMGGLKRRLTKSTKRGHQTTPKSCPIW